jgi:hypothetical protein
MNAILFDVGDPFDVTDLVHVDDLMDVDMADEESG